MSDQKPQSIPGTKEKLESSPEGKEEEPLEEEEEDTEPNLQAEFAAAEEKRLADPRFNPPTPSRWKRAGLLVLVFVLFWVAISMRKSMRNAPPKVLYANRYSKDYKFRPAASPIITERLKDGRTRVHGAAPTAKM
ncbi:uncharacterized protein STEHIDRAFT_141539 [Stereum hirsutum FP-91666 SS1]|uniref:uncharacterized protein n=1 Tax=Stereum hirsutum (strain FP-91666) TaxID=721885 RepID=UPI0004449E66|nr:uncharacterized protein STEHIDRAFT_141539 [Stereum hirsutum FP-91666 SS1]EIM83011.1 hypothetical protein STEHIDRAFT_141539 [Stereum hirsutum FP-91666 SS1]